MSTLRDLFDRIQDVAASERECWIEENCQEATTRRQLRALLRHQTTGADPLARSIAERLAALDSLGSDEAPADRWLGRSIGAFRLTRLIGQGGMAVVFEAERVGADFSQRVAIKVLKRLVFSAVEERLFRRERQALAALTHPNIARLIDGGIAADGTPYLAVELIDGLPITDYCRQRALELHERLRLFATVCRAVEAAHHALIVHRDIKPSNILVTAAGQTKLLDFGIAKLLDDDSDSTRTGHAALTPDYAAPEQFVGGPITTATDVYSLGVLLHELLHGHRPTGRLRRPETLPPAAGKTPLRRRRHGDLDNIIGQALEEEAERRYGAAGALAEDVERYLDGLPVAAHPPSALYRAKKFVQRHRGSVFLALVFVLAIFGSLGVAVLQAERAARQALLAREQSDRASLVRDFVVELMRDLRPGVSYNSPQTLIEHAERRARERFAADPHTRAELLVVVGDLERGYGRLERSRALLEEAASVARREQGAGSPLWLDAEAFLGHTAHRQGFNIEGAERLSAAMREYDAAGGVAGAERVRALTYLGMLRMTGGEASVPIALQHDAVQLAARVLPPTDPLQQTVLENYGDALANGGRLDQAREVLTESLQRARRLYGNRDLAVISALEALAVCETAREQPAAALPLLDEAQALLHELVAGPHVMAAYVANTRGNAELHLGRPLAAQSSYEAALEVYRKLLQPPHPMLAATHDNLGEAAFEQGRFQRAAEAFGEAAAQREALAGTTAFDGYNLRCLVGEALAMGPDLKAGLAQLQRCVDSLRLNSERSQFLAGALGTLAYAQWQNGDRLQAEQRAREALALPPAATAHERLLPLIVKARADIAAGRPTALSGYADAALSAVATAHWTRPCQTARALRELAALSASAGATAAAAALRERAGRSNCESAPPTGPG